MTVALHVPRYADAPAALAKLARAKPRPGLETAFDVARDDLIAVLTALRDEHEYQQLMEIAGVDYPERPERFEVVYCLLSLTRNHRV
ncbi:MAG: NADH-quinone oxidoreductase subunit C, partial [Sphingomicrobium sp.]